MAVLLSLIIPGTGQMYAGRIVRGIVIFLATPVFFLFIFLPILFGSIFTTVVTNNPPFTNPPVQPVMFPFAFAFIPVLLILLWLGFIVWNIFDAYNLARIYNQQLMTTGRPPW